MTQNILELDAIKDLPLWAQVLIASRQCRRAALWLPLDTPAETRDSLLAGCDTLDHFARIGQREAAGMQVIQRVLRCKRGHDAEPAFSALYFAADSAHAAESSLDFGAAEVSCTHSAFKALAAVNGQNTLNPMQTRIVVAADLDLLRFACKENDVGRYDGLGDAVFGRLVPITAPDPKDIRSR